MSSQRRIDASRSNGAKSRGPATPEGLAKSALNSLRHGLASKTVVLTSESAARFEQVLDSYIDHFRPQTEVEMDLVEEMAVAKWRQRRAWSIETATLARELDCQDPELVKKWQRLDPATRLALAHQSLTERGPSLHLIGRYETRLRRHYDKSLQNLFLVKSKRSVTKTDFLPNEPNPESEQPDCEAARTTEPRP
jgi:hypothetical protein